MDYYHVFVFSSSLFVLTLSSCSPGLSKNGQKCFCNEGVYDSLITCESRCSNVTKMSCNVIIKPTLVRGGWIGNYSGEIVAGRSLYLYSLRSLSVGHDGIELPANWSEVDQVLCGGLRRTGVLCGDCKEGHGPTTDIHSYQCVKCSSADSHLNWLWYILLEYVPLTVLFFVLVVFSVDATSGAGNAFIFFAQMVTSVFDIFVDNIVPLDAVTHNHTHAVRALYQLPYGMWNLEFFTFLASPFCLSHKIGSYGIILIDYAIAFYPIALICLLSFVTWLNDKGLSIAVILCEPIHKCIFRFQRKWRLRRSIIGVFATFITLSYTKMVSTSVKLIKPSVLYNSKGRVVYSNIPAYNGNIKFTNPNLIAVYISAITILFVYIVVLPCLLIMPSFVKKLHRKTKWEWLTKILPQGKMQEFLEGFHSCYAIGGHSQQIDYRWFSGLFLALRGVFFLTAAFSNSAMEAYMFLSVLCFVTMFIIAWTRPFKVRRHNTLNMGIFCILGLISSINTFNSYRTIMWSPIWPALFWFEYLLLFVPLFAVIMNLIKWFQRRFKATPTTNNYFHQFEEYSEKESKSLPLMEDDPSIFLQFTENAGRLKNSSREVTWYISSRNSSSKIDDSVASTIQDYGSINN